VVGHRLNHPPILDILLLSCCGCRDVAKAGGELPEGWTVQLSSKQETGYYRSKIYTEPGSGKLIYIFGSRSRCDDGALAGKAPIGVGSWHSQ
jgi:hypothetical protein